jgi:hypothetical protein
MKLKFIISLIIIANSSHAQEILFPVTASGEIEFAEVVEVNNTKTKLFSNAKEWIAKTYGDYKVVVQFEDPVDGKIIIKGKSKVPLNVTSSTEYVYYTITIECRDNKYRYKIGDLSLLGTTEIFGVEAHSMNEYPFDHLKAINRYKSKRELLLTEDISKLNKKALDEHQREVEILGNSIKNEEFEYESEYKTIINLIGSLRLAMSQNDEF